ncbi:hypothetical protein RF11_04423 [Thelohanellus kitauei]|uniref:Uncharacterized protein n=1 Tax=Thelohanellus kitauei TaxID=669202 RepID=A0A0C2IVK4_THEKT|nr:hypothetical protein RF11_04423 [Thelohanellus kitauei]
MEEETKNAEMGHRWVFPVCRTIEHVSRTDQDGSRIYCYKRHSRRAETIYATISSSLVSFISPFLAYLNGYNNLLKTYLPESKQLYVGKPKEEGDLKLCLIKLKNRAESENTYSSHTHHLKSLDDNVNCGKFLDTMEPEETHDCSESALKIKAKIVYLVAATDIDLGKTAFLKVSRMLQPWADWTLFEGLRKWHKILLLHIMQPKIFRSRAVSFALKQKVEEEWSALMNKRIIVPVNLLKEKFSFESQIDVVPKEFIDIKGHHLECHVPSRDSNTRCANGYMGQCELVEQRRTSNEHPNRIDESGTTWSLYASIEG